MTATMIIFHGGDQLEFAGADGKSLGLVHHPRAGQVFQNIVSKEDADLRLRMIQENYVQLKPKATKGVEGQCPDREKNNETPAGNSAGFERTTQGGKPVSEPMDTHISNPNRDDYWSCPGCYHDLGNVGEGTHTCPECNRKIECTVELEPACHSRLEDQS